MNGPFFNNLLKVGLVPRAQDWPWASGPDYTGSLTAAGSAHRMLAIDRVRLPADERSQI